MRNELVKPQAVLVHEDATTHNYCMQRTAGRLTGVISTAALASRR